MPRLVALLLYGLLLFMQQEGIRHGFDHLRSELAQAHERAVTLPADGPCDECALLAGGASALLGAPAVPVAGLVDFALPATPPVVFQPAAGRYYSARGPPALS